MATMSNLRRTVGALLSGVALLALTTGCVSEGATAERGPQPIVGWSNSGDALIVWVGTCHGDPVATVAEDDESVTVTVTSTLHSPGDACQDSVDVPLDAQLGDRAVIDGVTGEPAPGIEG